MVNVNPAEVETNWGNPFFEPAIFLRKTCRFLIKTTIKNLPKKFMAKTRDQKKEMVSVIENISKENKSIVFVNFTNLLVKDETALRSKLRESGVGYKVVKKTLLKKGFGSSIDGQMPELPGMMAIAYGEDLIAPAREVYDFQKSHKDNIAIVGGVFDGKYMTKEEMMSIATIPPTQVLYGQFVNLINTPIQQFVTALSKIADLPAQTGQKTA